MELTNEQKQEIHKKLNATWSSTNCPKCGKAWVRVDDFLSEIREYHGENIPEDQKIEPVIILSCLVCGHMEYISPKILKITGF